MIDPLLDRPSHITADKLSHSIELAHCVKLYAPGAGNQDRVFLFPYRGRLSARKVTLMAADLMEFYPGESLSACEYAVRNLGERCAWTSISQPVTSSHPTVGQDVTLVTLRGDGWSNMRDPNAVVIFKTYTGD